jgi:hypothetical protein
LGQSKARKLNQAIVEFCKANMGKKVGGGQCSSVAYYALKHVGGKELNDFPPDPGKGDYVWGRHVFTGYVKKGEAVLEPVGNGHIRPGDVVQFRDTKFSTFSYGQHTAVVLKYDQRTTEMLIAQQNVNGRQMLVESTLTLKSLRTGWFRVYRPVPKRE